MRTSILFLMAICVAINVKPTCGMGTVYTPFHEETYDQEGDYLTDIDFDGFNEKICVDEYSNVKVYKVDCDGLYSKDVSATIPYCYLRIHRCCPAHRAYTTINYMQKTIYTEAHYGCCDFEIHQYKKVGESWSEIRPMTPLSIISKDLYPPHPRGWVYHWSRPVWEW